MFLKDQVQISIAKRSGNVVLRSDLAELGGSTQLSVALRTLTQEGKLVKLGSGIYAKASVGADGRVRLVSPEQTVAKEVFERLGVEARIVPVDGSGGETLYVLDTSKRRMSRNLKLDAGRIVIGRDRSVGSAVDSARLTDDVDELPRTGVGEFVRRLAETYQVVYKRTRLDDWAEAVTRAAGDDVKLDPTEKLLMLLTKKHIVSGRQAARLLNNYMEEEANVRSVQRLPNRRLSPQR